MTKQRHFKTRVRDRMAKTGESYTAARRQLLVQRGDASTEPATDGYEVEDLAGVHSATTAFRLLLRHSGHDVLEEDLLAIGGGIGIGVFAFRYDDFSSLFLAGRHLWHDDLLFIERLADRLGVELDVRETGSGAKAERDLFAALEQGPVIAFVDLGSLQYRGGVEAYYVVTVLEASEESGTARIADLAEEPVDVPLERLSEGRARHRKFKNRLVRIARAPKRIDVAAALPGGLRACIDGFRNPRMPGYHRNFTVDALDTLAGRMRGAGKDSWKQVFPPGPRLWGALAAFYEYVEHYGTGGGLMRPFWAESLATAGSRTGLDLASVSHAYGDLGRAWSEAAHAALPDDVDAFASLRRTIDDTYATYYASATGAADELDRLRDERRKQVHADFPLSDADTHRHVEHLADHVDGLAARERAALDALEAALRAT